LLPNYFNVTAPLHLIAAMNDVRSKGSPPLSWYYQAAVLISRGAKAFGSALSKHYIWSPMAPGAPFQTFYIPCSRESFIVFHGTLPLAGKSVRFNFHAHMSAFENALLFSASPAALQIPIPGTTWNSFEPSDLGLDNNFQMHESIMSRIAAQDNLICTTIVRRVEIEGAVYDRHAQMNCIEWEFGIGAPFTVVSFNGPSPRGACGRHKVTQHAHWWLTYVALDMRSHYTESLTQVMTQRMSTDGHVHGHQQPMRKQSFVDVSMLLLLALFGWSTCVSTLELL